MTKEQLDTAKNGIIKFLAGGLLLVGIAISSWSMAMASATNAKILVLEAKNDKDHEQFIRDDREMYMEQKAMGKQVSEIHDIVQEIGWKVGVERGNNE